MPNSTLKAALALFLLSVPAQAQVADRDFYRATGALVLSSLYDAETTARAIETGRAHEANPIAAPFATNRIGVYGYALATDALFIFITYKLKENGFKRWWLFPASLSFAHGVAGSLNLRFVN